MTKKEVSFFNYDNACECAKSVNGTIEIRWDSLGQKHYVVCYYKGAN